MIFRQNNTPRWFVFSMDLGITFVSLSLAYLLRFNFAIPEVEIKTFYFVYPAVIGFRALSFYLGKTYPGIIRYTGSRDAQRIFTVVTLGSLFFCFLNLLRYFVEGKFVIPFSVIIIDYFITTFFMISVRIAIKALYLELKNPTKAKSSVIIFGAGDAGIITKRTLDRDEGTKYKVKAFVDDNAKKAGKKIEGVPIYSADKLEELLADNDLENLIISIQNISPKRKSEVIEQCLAHNVRVLNVPPVANWINGELSVKQIRNIRIEDLLGRDQIKLDAKKIKSQLNGKRILISGAAGSIGSELVRQIAPFSPARIVLLDQAESSLYELELEMEKMFGNGLFEVVVGDVRNPERMENLFKTFRPEIVYHSAAYKHVPMMENNPSEAILTNVLGTRVMVDLAIKHQVKQFVMISTDKAVNPTNIMGASKRIAEMYAQSANRSGKTKFITTRFGNVLGSNGSVIPLFRKQISKGGPITVTHPDVTRYFMTIPEACQLVLEAGAMGQGGEIFIFDMGKSVKIIDLAKKMIKLSGLELNRDIRIDYIGLRPGEKLHEELLADKENTLPTHHPQIMIAKVREYKMESLTGNINELIDLYQRQDNEAIVRKMKEIVPEFISQNSIYSKFDVVNHQNNN